MGKALPVGNKIEAPKDVRPHDVICGRGTSFLTKVLSGNKSYRKLIERRMDKYEETTTKEKRAVNEAIVNLVLKRGGRFLEYDMKAKKWIDIGYERAVTKTAQGFRDFRYSPTYLATKKTASASKVSTVTPKKAPVKARHVEEEEKEEPAPPQKTQNTGADDNVLVESVDGNNSEDDDDTDSESESEEIKPFTGPLTFPIITPRKTCQAYKTVSPPSTRSSTSPSPSISSLTGTKTSTGENASFVLADGENEKRHKSDGSTGPPFMAYNFDYFPSTTPEHVIAAASSPHGCNGEREMFWYWKLK